MPRSRRAICPERAFHVICRGNNRQSVFYSDRDKRRYLRLLEDLTEENRIAIYHYCLMTNHTHIVVWLAAQSNLSRFMKQVNLSYCLYFHKIYGYSGHLWQGRFKSYLIDRENYLLQCGKYIELNPVRAGLVESPEQYEFSSYRYYANGESNFLITPNPAYLALARSESAKRRNYQEFVIQADRWMKLSGDVSGEGKRPRGGERPL